MVTLNNPAISGYHYQTSKSSTQESTSGTQASASGTQASTSGTQERTSGTQASTSGNHASETNITENFLVPDDIFERLIIVTQ